MKLHELIEASYQTFLEKLQTSRIVLLHPNSRYRSVLVARLINSPELTTFYYAMGPDDIDVQSLITGMTHDLANQFPTFGRHLHLISDSTHADFDANADVIVDTFVQDLSEISDGLFLLILDEYDRSDSADDVQSFVQKLVHKLPSNCRIVINSRTLPRLPWVSFIAQGWASLLLDDVVINENFYDLVNHEDGSLEIYALGPGFVLLSNEYIDAWEGHLPRLLLFFALDRPVVTRSDICRAFWPELDAEQAVNVFHVTKRRLHKALELDILVHDEGYYKINPELPIYYDVAEFVKLLMAARNPENPHRYDDWQRAIDLYRGPFLQGHDDKWIQERRVDYRAGYIEALQHMANFWEERGKPEQALTLYIKATTEDATLEDIHREIMRIYSQLGRRSEAAAHYQSLVEVLQKHETKPTEETQALYQEIMA